MAKPNSILFDLYVNKVYALCRKYTSDIDVAKDMMQECFLHLYENVDKYDSNQGNMDAWIYRVSTNVILKQLAKVKKIKANEAKQIVSCSEDLENDIEPIDTKMLFATLDDLPNGYKEVLCLYVLENKSHKEIALKLNISESTSRSQLYRAKIHFKNKFKNSSNEK